MKENVGFILLAIALVALGYWIGRLDEQKKSIKHYQAACVLSDCCRNMVDNLGGDAEEIYCDYIDNLDCDSVLCITAEDIKTYCWSY